jgi:hypothetical protein
MKKHTNSKSVRLTDALLHQVVGGSTGSQMLAGMATGAATGAGTSGTTGTPLGQLPDVKIPIILQVGPTGMR